MQNVTKIVSDFQVAVRKKGLLSWVELRNSHTATHIVERNEDEPKWKKAHICSLSPNYKLLDNVQQTPWWWSSFPACTNDNTHAPDAYCQDSSCALLFNCYTYFRLLINFILSSVRCSICCCFYSLGLCNVSFFFSVHFLFRFARHMQ